MTEMVILLPTMIAMWFGIDYFRSGYARRLQAIKRVSAAMISVKYPRWNWLCRMAQRRKARSQWKTMAP